MMNLNLRILFISLLLLPLPMLQVEIKDEGEISDEDICLPLDVDPQRVVDTIRDRGQMISRANEQLYDYNMVTDMLSRMLQSAQVELVYRKTYTTFLTQLAYKIIPDAGHCLTLEYHLQPAPLRNFLRKETPTLYLYALFCDDALSALFVVNSPQDPSRHVPHLGDFGAMFLVNPHGDATIQVPRFEDFARLHSPYSPIRRQLQPAPERPCSKNSWCPVFKHLRSGISGAFGTFGTSGIIDTYLNFRDQHSSSEYTCVDRVLSWKVQQGIESLSSGAINATSIISLQAREVDDSIVEETDGSSKPYLKSLSKHPVDKVVKKMIQDASDGLKSGLSPQMAGEGTGGVYFLRDSSGKKFVAVFKPMDEEPLAENNPRNTGVSTDGTGYRIGTWVGEGATKEVVAYLLDRGFSGVPPTVLVECLHPDFHHPDNVIRPKTGSLQSFIPNEGSLENIGPNRFIDDEILKISVLDIRLANADRHGGNILQVRDLNAKMIYVPIDHGYCLPESFEECTFEWLNSPKAERTYAPETVEYIRSLDADADIELLKLHGLEISSKAARTLKIATMLLQKGVEKGLTAARIGQIMCRGKYYEPSLLENMVEDAEKRGSDFLKALADVMEKKM